MGLSIFAHRKQEILRRKLQKQAEVMDLQIGLHKYHSYASSVAKGSITANDLMNCPASLYERMSNFAMNSHKMALENAEKNYNFIAKTPGAMPQIENAEMQKQYSQMVFKNLYDQSIQKSSEEEASKLNEFNKQGASTRATLTTELTMLDAELKANAEGEELASKSNSPKFGYDKVA